MNGNGDDFELKRALDGLPRSIKPPEDLWPAVRGRLEARRRPAWWQRPALRIAAGLALVAAGAGALALQRAEGGKWRVASLAGGAGAPRAFVVGDSLVTGDSARALLEVGTIGHVEVDPDTRLRLLEARATRHRLALSRGTIHARISAPPRLFVVETPSGTAVDLGCAYTLQVDSSGTSVLEVTLGWVSFQSAGREALVPAGFRIASRTGGAVGLPYADDATPALREAVRAFDAGHPDALEAVLDAARRQDAITLWHLLARAEGASRDSVYQRLASLVPPPADVSREAALRLDRGALRLWWEALPRTLPITPAWQRWVWTTWLRLFG